MSRNQDVHKYVLFDGDINASRWFLQFLTYWVAYSHMIPISLYVLIELLKLGQATLINNDLHMYYVPDNRYA